MLHSPCPGELGLNRLDPFVFSSLVAALTRGKSCIADLCISSQAQLSTELAARGLPKSGLKAELAQRLFDAIESQAGHFDIVEILPVPGLASSG